MPSTPCTRFRFRGCHFCNFGAKGLHNIYWVITSGTNLANFGTRGLHNIPWARFVTVGTRCYLFSILCQPSQSACLRARMSRRHTFPVTSVSGHIRLRGGGLFLRHPYRDIRTAQLGARSRPGQSLHESHESASAIIAARTCETGGSLTRIHVTSAWVTTGCRNCSVRKLHCVALRRSRARGTFVGEAFPAACRNLSNHTLLRAYRWPR
eukprot:COSAG02_NODE_2555_length_8532_cov_7.259900_3_plen_209_part_00